MSKECVKKIKNSVKCTRNEGIFGVYVGNLNKTKKIKKKVLTKGRRCGNII